MTVGEVTSTGSAFAEAYTYLRDRISDGRLRSGDRIKADAVAGQLGVSRMPVREAIRQLDSEGLVTMRPNRGAVVTVLNPDDILELFEMRSVLEGLAIRRAMERFDDDAFDELDIRLARLARARTDVNQWITRHHEFHDFICGLAGGQRLNMDVRRLRTAVEPYLRLVLGAPRSEGAVDEHRRIAEVIRRGDADAAEAVMREHILETAHDLIKLMALKPE